MKAKLEFKFQNWSGWTSDYQSEVFKIEVEMSAGDRLSSDAVSNKQGLGYKGDSIEVTEVSANNLEIKFHGYNLGTFSKKGEDGKAIFYKPENLGLVRKEPDENVIAAVLNKGQVVKVVSPTTDQGLIIEATLLEIMD